MTDQRHVPLQGARNFRDLGGYRAADGQTIAWGRVYRADRLTDLTRDDVAELLDVRGLKTVIDLRTSAEVARYGPGMIAPHVRRIHRSLLSPSLRLRPSLDYADWAIAGQDVLADIFAQMTADDDPFPLVFHCSVGKDRTGIVASLLLSALGTPRQTIIDDYALTRKYFNPNDDQIGKWRRRVLKHFPGLSQSVDSRALLDADPDTMRRLLDTLDARLGAVATFLDSLGINRDRLRARLLET
ncbi:MAG: tyrosine-protein phosphatase [Myxococcota bacterium]